MLEPVGQFLADLPLPTLIAGIVLLLSGGHLLVEGSVMVARRLGLSPLLIGLTIVAFGTSSPELAFNIIAALDDAGDLSFGNIVGSNIVNIALVLGVAAAATPLVVHSRVVQREMPAMLMISIFFLAAAWFFPHLVTETGPVRALARADGALMLIGFIAFLWMMLRMARSDKAEARRLEAEAGADIDSARPPSLILGGALFILGLGVLIGGGKLAEIGAIGVARALGVEEVVIALVIVALATSLPEVATSLIAVRKGQLDLAVGNVVGSNIFNILLVMGVTSVISPVAIPRGGMGDLIWMVGFTALVATIALIARNSIPRIGGIALLIGYALYLLFRAETSGITNIWPA